jgi:phosphonate dehydrogenase
MNRPRIVVTQRIHPEVYDLLATAGDVIANPNAEPWPASELRRFAAEADALLVFMPDRIDDAFLAQCPRLKVIAAALKGYDNFDIDACTRRKVWFTIVPARLSEPTAELALTLMLSVARNVLPGDRYVRREEFRGWRPILYGRTLYDATVGIVGYGAVGQALAQLLRPFRVRLIKHDISDSEDNLRMLLLESAFVVPLLPLTPATLHLFNADRLALMRPGACLVNVARGSLVDENAVAEALARGQLGGYAADTFEMEDWARADRPESIPPSLLESDRTVLTPHLGSAVKEARLEIERLAANSLLEALHGMRPDHAVNRF